MLRSRTAALLSALLVVILVVPSYQGNAQEGITFVEEIVKDAGIPGSAEVKLPSIDGVGDVVHLAGNPDQRAAYWSKRDSATSWPNRTSIGSAGGVPDFSTAAIGVSPDGSAVYVAWLDHNTDALYIRRRLPDGTFASQRRIAEFDSFASDLKIAVTGRGTIFAVWNSNKRFLYSISRNGGNSWSEIEVVADIEAFGTPWVAAGINGEVLIGFYSRGQVYAAVWNGNGFDSTRIDRGGDFANPTAAVAPNGNLYVAWRDVPRGEVWYAERRPGENWRASLLVRGGETAGVVSITADPDSNLHMFWINNLAGDNDIYHAFRKANTDEWTSPLRIDVRDFVANLDGTATLTGLSYGHVAYEVFIGGSLRTRYSLVAADVDPVTPVGAIQINDGVPVTASPNVALQLGVTVGRADQYQLSNDGTNFTDFAPLPENGIIPAWEIADAPADTTACVERTVYARIREAGNPALVSEVLADSIQLDPGVDAAVEVRNPFMQRNPPVLVDTALQVAESFGARTGDPRYTRSSLYFLDVRGLPGECSNLAEVQVGQTRAGIVDNHYVTIRPLALYDTPEGENTVTMRVRDGAGYQRTFQQTIYVDTVPPQIQGGTPEVVDAAGEPLGTTDYILVSLRFSDMQVTDQGYGEQEDQPFWGVWLANSREAIDLANTAALDRLDWTVVALPSATQTDTGYTFSVANWNIFNGVPSNLRQGGQAYHIYARMLDGAGNPSPQTLTYTITLSEDFRVPTLNLPVVQR